MFSGAIYIDPVSPGRSIPVFESSPRFLKYFPNLSASIIFASIIKSTVFAFIISSVASYHGYTVEGGSFDVGKASTNAVVSSSMLILFSDIFLTSLLA